MKDDNPAMGGGTTETLVQNPESPLDAYLPRDVREEIERTYYAKVNERCELGAAVKDPRFLENPSKHVALFADHGVVHVRDVAHQVLDVLDAANGVLIPARDDRRLAWMKAYGVAVAYIHDIGMMDLSAMGRAMHPEYATQAVLGEAFDGLFKRIRSDNLGDIAGRLAAAHDAEGFSGQPPEPVLREMLAMANCHSKSKIPVAILNDRPRLRRAMQEAAAHELETLYHRQRARSDDLSAEDDDAWIDATKSGSFAWIEASEAADKTIVDDVIDTLRALRCADALRQRGTVMKTSGNYEVFIDRQSANAVYALRLDESQLYMLEVSDPISAGEANISSSQIDHDGDLRIAFHHGAFKDTEATASAARSAALIVNDVQADAVESFARPDGESTAGMRAHGDISIDLEDAEDNPDFTRAVRRELERINPVAADRVRFVPSLGSGSLVERGRYVTGMTLDWDEARAEALLDQIAAHGQSLPDADPLDRLRDVRLIKLRAGEVLVEAGTEPDFVYLPLSEGLRGTPLGGYEAFTIGALVLVGVTGAIRGASRNAKVFADRDMELLAIPRTVYLDRWHATYTRESFAALFR